MAAERASWEAVAALREAIRRDALELRNRYAAVRGRYRAAWAVPRRWSVLVAFGWRIAEALWRRRPAGRAR